MDKDIGLFVFGVPACLMVFAFAISCFRMVAHCSTCGPDDRYGEGER